MKLLLTLLPASLTLTLCTSAFAEHTTFLRGIINLPDLKAALVEMHYTFPGQTNTTRPATKNSRLVRVGESFEDKTIKDGYFQFQVVDIDWARQTLKTREGGEENTYTLAPQQRPNDTAWLQLQEADFFAAVDLYGRLVGRTVLLHPKVPTGPVSFRWSGATPTPVQLGLAFAGCWKMTRDAAVLMDGTKFVQLIPAVLRDKAKRKSQDLPAETAAPGSMSFKGADAASVVQIYAAISGRQLAGTVPGNRGGLYLQTMGNLSKPEALYALETLLAWHGFKIVPGSGNSFSIELIHE